MHGIHLKRPVDNQVLRTNISDPPESFYQERRAPSADIFEWDKVPGAAYTTKPLSLRCAALNSALNSSH